MEAINREVSLHTVAPYRLAGASCFEPAYCTCMPIHVIVPSKSSTKAARYALAMALRARGIFCHLHVHRVLVSRGFSAGVSVQPDYRSLH